MGWASGSGLMSELIGVLGPRLDDDARRGVYADLIRAFERYDCDTLDECVGDDEVFDEAYALVHPYEGDYQAAERGAEPGANPHRPRTTDHREWARGFKDRTAEDV